MAGFCSAYERFINVASMKHVNGGDCMWARMRVSVLCLLFLFVLVSCQNSEHAARIRKGNWLLEQKLYDEAIAEYKQAIQINPESKGARCGLGSAYLEKGMLDEAGTEFRAVLELDPDHEAARIGLKKMLLLSSDEFKCVKFDFPLVNVLDFGANAGLKVGDRLKAYDSQANYVGEVELVKVEAESSRFKKLAPFAQAGFLVHQYPCFFPGEKGKRLVCISFASVDLWMEDKQTRREEVTKELVKILQRKSVLDEFEFVVSAEPPLRQDCWARLTIDYREQGGHGFRLQEPVVEVGKVVVRPVLVRTTAIALRLRLRNEDRKKTTWDRYTVRIAPPRSTSFREGETASEKEKSLRAEVFAKLEGAIRPLLPEFP